MPKIADQFWEYYCHNQYCWTLQTYLYLKESNFPCQLVAEMPDEGIVFAHRDGLSYNFQPSSKLLLVCFKADQNSHPYAQLHIVQNPQEVTAGTIEIQSITQDRYLLPGKRYYMPLWRQPGLIPRNPNRGDLFENVFYFGITHNLAPELKDYSWERELNKLGLKWRVEGDRWHDYSEVDAVVAIRRFNDQCDYPWKPATKLYNAWLAGVPAILSPESAFREEKRSELDYIEVNIVDELIYALKCLRDNPNLRQKMIENGIKRAEEINPENLTKRWCHLIKDICFPAYDEWCSLSSWKRKQYFLGRYLALKINVIQRRLLRLSL